MLYILRNDRSVDSASNLAEDIRPGLGVAFNSSGNLRKANGDDSQFIGIAAGMESGEWIADDGEDYRTNYEDFVYPAANDHPVPYGGGEDRAELRTLTAKDNGTDPAPSISGGDVVGYASATGTLASAAEFAGRLVQEGYTDGAGTPTTYNRTNGNFLPVGVAQRASPQIREAGGTLSAFDSLLHVEVRNNL